MSHSSAERRRLPGCAAAALLALLAGAARAADLHIGGGLGFGLRAVQQAGHFGWDFDTAREETTLAELKLGSRPVPGLEAYASFRARLDATRGGERPFFEFGEGSLRYSWRQATGDSLSVRLFARQPNNLWLDHALVPPVVATAAGGEAAQGVRADAAWRSLSATLVTVDRGDARGSGTAANGDASIFLGRLRADATRLAGLRLGATFVRLLPAAFLLGSDARTTEARHRDLAALDLCLDWRQVLGMLSFETTRARFGTPDAEAAQEPGRRSTWRWHASRRLTDILPSDAALRAEVRAPRLRMGNRGWFGFAPSYRALGANYTNRLAAPEPDAGSPRRGLEGHRLEAWYELASWPAWARQIYERHDEFRDAERRTVLQASEVEALVTSPLRARLRYVQRDIGAVGARPSEHHDDLVADVWVEQSQARARLQAAVVDLNAAAERGTLACEISTHVVGRLQALARLAFASTGPRTRSTLFAELQYWHLPEFEVLLQYGPEWSGDAADPALDGDLVAAGERRDLVRLHFRGWF